MNSSRPSESNGTTLDEWSMVSTSVACVILGLSFLVGAPGNLLVIWTILRHIKQRSHAVVLILHLAIADLLVLVTLPLWIYSLVNSWIFGDVACKAISYLVNACMYSSVFLIATMSMERYVAIRYPFTLLGWKSLDVLNKCLGVVWLLSFLLGIPVILIDYVDVNDNGALQCIFKNFTSVTQQLVCLSIETSIGFVIPFSILAICYCQVATQLKQIHSTTKQRSTILISRVVAAFALLWLPHHTLNVVDIIVVSRQISEPDFQEYFVLIAGALAFISSSVNPVLYAFVARNFKGGLRRSGFVKLFHDIASNSSKARETSKAHDNNAQTEI